MKLTGGKKGNIYFIYGSMILVVDHSDNERRTS